MYGTHLETEVDQVFQEPLQAQFPVVVLYRLLAVPGLTGDASQALFESDGGGLPV
jgi:hypothetical protein